MEFITDHPDVFFYLFLVVIEQVLLLFPGSYPYTLGIPVRFIPLNVNEEEVKGRLAESLVRLRYRINESRKEVYFYNPLPMGTWGPLLVVGQIVLHGRGRIIIRMAPVTALGLGYPFLRSIGMLKLSGFIFALLLVVLVYFFYRRLVRNLDVLL